MSRLSAGIPLMVTACVLVLSGCGGGAKSDAKPEVKPASKTPLAAEKSKTPLVPKVEIADWCPEHGVPESICTRCNDKLTDDFKKKGDWCATHNLPESQCFVCHPDLKAKFEAMKPKAAQEKK